jgi:hypothetical protein
MAEARMGMENLKLPIVKSIFVWSGLMDTSPGTRATSSNPYVGTISLNLE